MIQSGPNPYWSLLTAWVMLRSKYWVVVVTDRAVVVMSASKMRPSFVKKDPEIIRYPLQQFPKLSGLYGKVDFGDAEYHVHRRFHKDFHAVNEHITAANPALSVDVSELSAADVIQPTNGYGNPASVPAGWFPDPHGQAAQRYWDGEQWTSHIA